MCPILYSPDFRISLLFVSLPILQILAHRGYEVKERGIIKVKGKGEMLTFYVNGRKKPRIVKAQNGFIQCKPVKRVLSLE